MWNIELPGFGESKKAPDDWGTPEFAKHIARFIKSTVLANDKDKKYYLFGHSFGGSLTAYVAANLWPKPEKIILCSSAGLRYRSKKAWVLLPIAKASKVLLWPMSDNFKKKLRKNIYYYVIRERDYVDTADRKEQFIKIMNYDMTGIFKKISIPALIVWGKQDKVTPLKMGRKINTLIRGSKLEVIEGRHGIPITEAQKVASLVGKFISNN
ncbi:MAG: 2-hydroxy-6-oxohepta-2,4-dienoate hydrolase [candidate division WS6 bacterium GW2011_GWA2_37_6]|uniref:2-hydroxy-6-oxohepta-2,4-dienoate hydrolase n=1 Tax=candidate division WS6 bacterium GW2011_GWA2_37_6 TaxID=1619087 RepID=A0A0G0GTS7_9BACT|nr:MAG: 2-hydroxy-6-oxohepta-2,4-dienoate hydrolase [candidate division WS6 bacterium GW2011_GWA2_37_6]